jgi:hypothetical protein
VTERRDEGPQWTVVPSKKKKKKEEEEEGEGWRREGGGSFEVYNFIYPA